MHFTLADQVNAVLVFYMDGRSLSLVKSGVLAAQRWDGLPHTTKNNVLRSARALSALRGQVMGLGTISSCVANENLKPVEGWDGNYVAGDQLVENLIIFPLQKADGTPFLNDELDALPALPQIAALANVN